jgi:4-alpha-glucanotransferase
MEFARQSGILLHPTSLPGNFGVGSIGNEAFEFIDFLYESGQKLWQILPIGPTGYGESPYQCFSSIAGNPILISLEKLVEDGLLDKSDIDGYECKNEKTVNFEKAKKIKYLLLEKAYKTFAKTITNNNHFLIFCSDNSFWLDDFSLYFSLKEEFDQEPWNKWPNGIRLRTDENINKYSSKLKGRIIFHKVVQFIFFKQWLNVKKYANSKGIKIIGDIPLYIAYDSADTWTSPENFHFDSNGKPLQVAGVPPDYFSKTGQLWGNPIYNWKHLEQDNFSWWIKRIRMNLRLFDIIRIDHFRGLAAYWSVPYGEKTAVNGRWINAPGKKLFKTLIKELGDLPIIAEDLGVITPDVEELRDSFQFPGMKILQFAFDSKEKNEYLPHTFNKNCVVYTGTHDNNTTIGWYKSITAADRKFVKEYIGTFEEGIAKALTRLAWSSVANVAIVPLQDILGVDEEGRMNLPGTRSKNWIWRYRQNDLTANHAEWLNKLTKTYCR